MMTGIPAPVPGVAWVIPFLLLILTIALAPLVAPELWSSNGRKLACAVLLATPVIVRYAAADPHALAETASQYASFILLLAALFAIAGGIWLTGDLPATPAVNTAFLAAGAVLASAIGTTGASMLLIRPLLQTNRERRRVTHTVVFFIFLVSNIGGCLTPLGDPPLFLGYLPPNRVPFWWTLRLGRMWALAVTILLILYYCWDRREHARERPEDLRRDAVDVRPLRLQGWLNFPLLVGVILAVAFLPAPWREGALIVLVALSLALTPPAVRAGNGFEWGPLVEVAALFVGVFATMLPALDLLRERGAELHVTAPWHYFWASGVLSSFLDNAPTYAAFLALAQGQHLAEEVARVPHVILEAISTGAVFMGANTYIGNGPNLLVRAIAEKKHVSMPSFAGYMAYSGAVLVPLYALLTLVFFL